MNTKNDTGRLARSFAITLTTLIFALFLFAASAQATTYVVNSTADDLNSGCTNPNLTCTLRDAITEANNHPGPDIINFNIQSGGVQTIVLTGDLPPIDGTVTIDGYSQPGTKANTLAQGDNAVLLIEIDGSVISNQIIDIGAPNCLIRGLIIVRSQDTGITVRTNGNVITGNFIGTNASGSYLPNGLTGIFINNSSNNTIGGTTPAARNVISGNTYPVNNTGAGIHVGGNSAANNKIQGNYIGVNKEATLALTGNQYGIIIDTGAQLTTVGGATAGAGNLISGNAHDGIGIFNSDSNVVEGNFIGTNASGNAAFSNDKGIFIAGASVANKIGDAAANTGNVISGNRGVGIMLSGNGTMLNEVFSNLIGTRADGVNALGNASHGVQIAQGANGNYIGSFGAGAANIIAYNGANGAQHGSGVRLDKDAGTGNSINGNSIFSNDTLGIDLQAPVDTVGTPVTPNDLNDGDSGANSLQNYPVITSAVTSGGVTTITGTLNSVSNEPFRVEIFANPTCSDSGSGEGKGYIGNTTVTTNGNNGTFTFTSVAFNAGQFVTATATDLGPLNTSEFSQCKQVTAPPTAGSIAFIGANYSITEGSGPATINVARSGGSNGAISVHYQSGGGTATTNSDYTPVSGTLSWAYGDTANKTFTIPVVDDNLDEPDETVGITLSNPTGGATLGNQSSATLTIIDNDPPAVLSISDVSQAEGNSGTTSFVFDVTRSALSGQTVSVDYAVVAGGTASAGTDYAPMSGTVTFAFGAVSQTVTVFVNGDTQIEPDETFFVQLSNPVNATLGKAKGTGTIINDDAPAAPILDFSQANYSVAEQLGAVSVTVTRSGDTSQAAAVDYHTVDGSATQKGDFEITAGTLNFAPGETSKTIAVLINQDSYVEGPESFNLVLSNPSGATLGQSTTTVDITDDQPESLTSPIDDPQSFVYMNYHDFLNREPDQAGLQFWTNEIASCGQDAVCIANKRTTVSAAFFLSVEFQQTGYLLYLFQKESFASLPKYNSFMRDLQEVSQGVIVNQQGWEQKLAANQQQLANEWVERPSFKAQYDAMSNADYVNALYANAGVVPPQAERDGLVSKLDTANESRAAALLDVAANTTFRQQEQNSAFVLMQYFGYLRRDPDADPDPDLGGYYFWLNKLNAFNGDYQQAEMVKAFILSGEYRHRFGAQ